MWTWSVEQKNQSQFSPVLLLEGPPKNLEILYLETWHCPSFYSVFPSPSDHLITCIILYFCLFFLENLKVCFCLPSLMFSCCRGSCLSLLSWGPCCSLLESSQISLNVDPLPHILRRPCIKKQGGMPEAQHSRLVPWLPCIQPHNIPLCKHARSQRPDLD